MKEKTNIEDLFREKFENFEANVDPSLWANISQSINATGATGAGASAAGLSGLAKVAIITAAVAVTSVSVWYLTKDAEHTETAVQENTITPDNGNEDVSIVSINNENIQVNDTNDPVIRDNRNEIQEDLSTVQISTEHFDDELIDILRENQNTVSNSNDQKETNNNNSVTVQNGTTTTDQSTIVDNNGTTQNTETPVQEAKKIKTDLQYQVDGSTLTFNSGAKNHISVEWNFGDETKMVCDKGTHTYKRPGSYIGTMKVVGENNTKVVEFPVEIEGTSEISEIPNVITPNNDGANDYFFIKSKDIEEFSITIYNMNGDAIFTSEDPDFRWYGDGPDGEVKAGTYLFKILAVGKDGAIYKEAKMLNVAK
ncbi:MAG: gliding motility-associated C-terminal domain-containing protein [Crocinitomicaceae bacterium]|nr:gliding motility-associated C-terminal domain-containing protein [Crocinitomicaceae bacterium]